MTNSETFTCIEYLTTHGMCTTRSYAGEN
ncbi:hypothetical protein S40293_09990 [Stachybotrys chartarum IBT 40293]|nr:hypothetical protein S40293_09990 [Stachybotrys chartarum IBT 40293]